MLLDVYVFTKDMKKEDLPSKGNYYVIAKNGNFIHKDTPLMKGFVKTKEIKGLAHLDSSICPQLPKIPVEIIYKSLLFFREVYDKYKSEAAVMLYYKQDTKEYYLYCPYQEVSGGSVDYDVDFDVNNEEHRAITNWFRENNYRRVGTIHSHCDFGAFHSGTDVHDEKDKNGIHITLGHVNKEHFSMVASFAVNDNRFQVSPPDVVMGLIPQSGETSKTYSYLMQWREPDRYFDVDLDDEKLAALDEEFMPEIIEEWMPLVEKKNFGYYRGNNTYSFGFGWDQNKSGYEAREVTISKENEETSLAGEPVEQDTGSSIPLLSDHDANFLWKVRSHARALKSHSANIPSPRLHELTNTLREFFGRDQITGEDVDLAARVNPKEGAYDAEEAKTN